MAKRKLSDKAKKFFGAKKGEDGADSMKDEIQMSDRKTKRSKKKARTSRRGSRR